MTKPKMKRSLLLDQRSVLKEERVPEWTMNLKSLTSKIVSGTSISVSDEHNKFKGFFFNYRSNDSFEEVCLKIYTENSFGAESVGKMN